MKKRMMALAAVAACGAAQAQSSVTMYGVVDANVEYVNHVGVVPQVANQFNPGDGQKVFRQNAGGLSGSRWGLRGTEDLGGGLKSVFALEGGFNSDTGTLQQGGRIFGRQAFVGLQTTIGQFSFGRQYSSLFNSTSNFVPARYANQYEPGGVIAGFNYRQDNTAKYLGTFGPLTAVAHWSFGTSVAQARNTPASVAVGGSGEVPGDFRRDSAYGAGLNYLAGPLGLGVGYDQWNPSIGTGIGSFKKFAVMASYEVAGVKAMGGYRWGQNKNQSDVVILRDDFYWVGATYQFSPSITFMLEYDYQNVKNLIGSSNFANPWQIAFNATYAFSKRTDVYLTTAFSKHAGLAMDSAATGFATSQALGNSYVLGRGQDSMFGVAVGVRHVF